MRVRFFISVVIGVISVGTFPIHGEELTVESIYQDFNFTEKLPAKLKWLPESDRYSYITTDSSLGEKVLTVESALDGTSHVILRKSDLKPSKFDSTSTVSLRSYQWLPNEDGLIFRGDGDVWWYSNSNANLTRLTQTETKEEEVQISPDSRYVSYVREYNLYVTDLETQEEWALTTSGNDQLFNGKLDWVYQEELVGRGIFKGYWWSPDSRHIAYLQFDESPVPDYPLVDEIPYHPELVMMQYPKAGDSNPVVKLGVVNVEKSPETVWMDVGEDTSQYLPRVYWIPDGQRLAFMRLDRYQQHLELLVADISDGTSRVCLEEQDPSWINIEDQVHFFQDSKRFLWGSDRSGYRHLYLYNLQGELLRQLTSGDWVVTELSGVDEENGQIYFLSNRIDVKQRQLDRVNLDGTGLQQITEKTGTHSVAFSESHRYFIDKFDDVLTPTQYSLYTSDGSMQRYIEENLQPGLDKFNLQPPEFFTFQGESGITFYASMLKPPKFDPDEKYPVLVYVYGGPHAQVVRREFGRKRNLWHQMLAKKGYIIFSMDNRGSYGRGHQWEQVIYKHLGETEFRDQLQGVKYLKSQPYVDVNRIGIWGWSYGGYMTLFALTHTDAFSTGISVAPVTDWRNYDTIYTERYMGLPSDNADGYKRSAPRHAAGDLAGKLLLIHGTADDNVHFQNSLQMVDALIEAGKDFDLMVYPQQTHGIGPSKDRIHLFEKMTKFIEENL